MKKNYLFKGAQPLLHVPNVKELEYFGWQLTLRADPDVTAATAALRLVPRHHRRSVRQTAAGVLLKRPMCRRHATAVEQRPAEPARLQLRPESVGVEVDRRRHRRFRPWQASVSEPTMRIDQQVQGSWRVFCVFFSNQNPI